VIQYQPRDVFSRKVLIIGGNRLFNDWLTKIL